MNLPFFVQVSGTVVSDRQQFWVGNIVDKVEQGRCTSLLQNLKTIYITSLIMYIYTSYIPIVLCSHFLTQDLASSSKRLSLYE